MYLTISQIAAELGVSRQCVHQSYLGKYLNAERVGNQLLIPKKDFDAFKKLERPPGRPPEKAHA